MASSDGAAAAALRPLHAALPRLYPRAVARGAAGSATDTFSPWGFVDSATLVAMARGETTQPA